MSRSRKSQKSDSKAVSRTRKVLSCRRILSQNILYLKSSCRILSQNTLYLKSSRWILSQNTFHLKSSRRILSQNTFHLKSSDSTGISACRIALSSRFFACKRMCIQLSRRFFRTCRAETALFAVQKACAECRTALSRRFFGLIRCVGLDFSLMGEPLSR